MYIKIRVQLIYSDIYNNIRYVASPAHTPNHDLSEDTH